MSSPQKTCFVVMGFGEKSDFESGRKLNLDASYQGLIKPSVEAAGLKCIRADEIAHSGVIDVPMYKQLLLADLVIADVSTANCNAFYELGVRHALRPYTTIIISEDKFKFPFDIGHIVVRTYKHLGEDIGITEAKRFTAALEKAIREIMAHESPEDDSPVYTFLHGLRRLKLPGDYNEKGAPPVNPAAEASDPTHSETMKQIDDAQNQGNFGAAKFLLGLVRAKRPDDPYITQRLALLTYKDKSQPFEQRYEEARGLLATLNPATSNDTETLGLWGAVHKNLWGESGGAAHLDEAVRGYERGFYIRNDYYNGINFAYMLNVRAANAADRAEAVADFVQARRIREEVITICDEWLASNPAPPDNASDEAKHQYLDKKYWVVASKAEAYLGTGKTAEADAVYEEAYAFAPAGWMIDSTKVQRAKLEELLAKSPLKYVKTDGE